MRNYIRSFYWNGVAGGLLLAGIVMCVTVPIILMGVQPPRDWLDVCITAWSVSPGAMFVATAFFMAMRTYRMHRDIQAHLAYFGRRLVNYHVRDVGECQRAGMNMAWHDVTMRGVDKRA